MQTASINKYATVEFRMVFTLLKFSTSKPDRSGSPPLFSLDKTLRDLLHKLGKALNSNLDAVEDALRGVLDNLYFPPQENREQSYQKAVHAFPVLQYIIYSFVSSDGSYLAIHRLPPILAAHQYCFRLRGLHRRSLYAAVGGGQVAQRRVLVGQYERLRRAGQR